MLALRRRGVQAKLTQERDEQRVLLRDHVALLAEEVAQLGDDGRLIGRLLRRRCGRPEDPFEVGQIPLADAAA